MYASRSLTQGRRPYGDAVLVSWSPEATNRHKAAGLVYIKAASKVTCILPHWQHCAAHRSAPVGLAHRGQCLERVMTHKSDGIISVHARLHGRLVELIIWRSAYRYCGDL